MVFDLRSVVIPVMISTFHWALAYLRKEGNSVSYILLDSSGNENSLYSPFHIQMKGLFVVCGANNFQCGSKRCLVTNLLFNFR